MARTDNKRTEGKHYAKSPGKRTTGRSTSSGTRSSASKPKHAASSSSKSSARSKSSAGTRRASTRRKAAPAKRRSPWRKRIRNLILVLGIILIAGVVKIHMDTHAERINSDGYTHADKYANYLVVDGIDVSYAQADIRDWRKIKRSGVDFVIIRGGYRSSGDGKLHEDSYFKDNIKGAQKAGLMVGVYFFSQAKNTKEARKEADYLVKLVKKYDVDLPLVMDYETVPGGRLDKALASGKLDSGKLNKIAKAFAEEVEAAGYESMIYANLDFLRNRFNGGKLSKFTNVWMAHFNDSTSYENEYMIWQCADNSSVPGIEGAVDKDFMYIDTESVRKTRGARNEGAKSLGDCQVEITDHSNTYLGANVEPGASVYDGRRALKEGRDYRASYVHNTQAGTGYVIVTGIGDYKDQVTMSFLIKGL